MIEHLPDQFVVSHHHVVIEILPGLAEVVDEITLVGSRCGPFASALELLAEDAVEVGPLVDGVYSMDDALEAFEHAARRGTLKILLETGSD